MLNFGWNKLLPEPAPQLLVQSDLGVTYIAFQFDDRVDFSFLYF